MPSHVAPKDWSNPAEVSMPDYVEFFPDLVARSALQDVRLTDLKAVAERKRAIWADTWKAVHSNDTNVDLDSRVKELEYKLHQALQQKQQAVVNLQATEKEHDRLVVEKKSLQKKYEDDQDLIMHQQRMLAEGSKVLSGLELKVTALEATRREQREQLEALQERQLNFSRQVSSLKQEVYEKTQEIFQLGADKEELLRRIQMLQHRLLQQAQLATQLKAAQREDVALKEQLNATLADEAAQARTNAALTQEVQTLEAENHRLASIDLGGKRPWGTQL